MSTGRLIQVELDCGCRYQSNPTEPVPALCPLSLMVERKILNLVARVQFPQGVLGSIAHRDITMESKWRAVVR